MTQLAQLKQSSPRHSPHAGKQEIPCLRHVQAFEEQGLEDLQLQRILGCKLDGAYARSVVIGVIELPLFFQPHSNKFSLTSSSIHRHCIIW